MLAGLIFTGIRILLSSNSPQKRSTYLMLLQDWLMGMILLIFSHIIMIGIFYISDTLTNALSLSLMGFGGLNANLIFQCLQSFDSAEQIVCLIMLGYMIYLTVVFAFAYFKRLLWICVLTVFAPVTSVMYAFGHQTKQIYSNWLKEYIMTVLVQPFHMIVYWVLISIPLNTVNSTGQFDWGSNLFEIVYALVAMSFIRPAEAYMRQLFGMDKGIAATASFDSGKQVFDNIKEAGKAIADAGVIAAKAVATGGTTLPGDAEKLKQDGDKLKSATSLENNLGGGVKEHNNPDGNSNLIDSGQARPKFETNAPSNNDDTLDDQIEIKESKERLLKRLLTGMANMPIETLKTGNAILNGDASIVDTTKSMWEKGMKIPKLIWEKGMEIPVVSIPIIKGVKKLRQTKKFKQVAGKLSYGMNYGMNFAKAFEDAGGFKELYKGANKVRDGFFVTPPPKDWQKTAERMDSGLDQKKYNFINNNENKAYFEEKFFVELREQYDKDKYNDAYIRALAKEKAKTKLTSLADTYVPRGITKASTADEIEKDRQTFGLTVEEAIDRRANLERQKANFDSFNVNSSNTAHINSKYEVNVSRVSDAIPNAREYYNHGYDNIVDMQKVDALQRKLNLSLDMAMKMDKVLKKGDIDKVNYKGNNPEIKQIVDDIKKNYNNEEKK